MNPNIMEGVFSEVALEIQRACKKHPKYMSPEHTFGVLYEEAVIEFGKAMHENNKAEQRTELIQVAAVAIRAILDLYEKQNDLTTELTYQQKIKEIANAIMNDMDREEQSEGSHESYMAFAEDLNKALNRIGFLVIRGSTSS